MPRDHEYLLDILIASRRIVEYVAGISKDMWLRDVKSQDAVIRRLEVIGEASRRVSEDVRLELSQLPWSSMVSMRNVLIHEYDDVDAELVWDTVQNDIPELVSKLESVLRSDTQKSV